MYNVHEKHSIFRVWLGHIATVAFCEVPLPIRVLTFKVRKGIKNTNPIPFNVRYLFHDCFEENRNLKCN